MEALLIIIANTQPQPSAPAPAPVEQRTWEFATDGDGSIRLNNGNADISLVGVNDGNGSGYSIIYSFFEQPTLITLNYQWSTNDGFQYDYPIIGEQFGTNFIQLPVSEDRFPFEVYQNYEESSISFQTSANSIFFVGIYSLDSVGGAGFLSLQGLPLS
jgi:hypothetical protein